MERDAMKKLFDWKQKYNRKPLIIRGARQTGKTWLMKEFGKRAYEKTAYVNLETSLSLQNVFKEGFSTEQIISALQIDTGIMISSENTLIILDEIQAADGALTSLKYFCENAPQYHILAAGSLLGVMFHHNASFPVGKVDFLDLYPLSFQEFLSATGNAQLLELLRQGDWSLINSFKEQFIYLLRQYYYVGGMPEAVAEFAQQNSFSEVRAIQKRILIAYEQDFSKHAPYDIVPRIRMLWNSIPAQLAKENRKFIYGALRTGARAKEYELALMWLIDCGLVHKINKVSKPGMPLKAYEDTQMFKLFVNDVGLLAAMNDIDAKTLLEGNAIFEEFKGALTEQYVLQQFLSQRNVVVFYWTAENATSEIDFVIQCNGHIIPIEVKAEENLQAKSLKVFSQKYNPEIAVRTSMSAYRQESWMINIPLFAIGTWTNRLSEHNIR